jgi:hypothetical protein
MTEARGALFRALDVTGIVNGAELRTSNVWPKISAPFCLLFARNRVAPPGAGFRFVSPRLESQLNRAGALRIDVANSVVVAVDQIIDRPETLKILFRGGPLDLELIERIAAREIGTLKEYWQTYFGGSGRRLRHAGSGYQSLRPSSPENEVDGERGVSSGDLHEMQELTPEAMESVIINRDLLHDFERTRLHRVRDPAIFRGPLLLVHKSPPASTGRIRVAVSSQNLVFSETYYGYSAATHPNGMRLAQYLALLVGSKPALWYCLITSGEFGFEREVIEKATIEEIPVPSFERFSKEDYDSIGSLFNAVALNDDKETWGEVDAWVAELYGLRASDLTVIDDTLRYGLPFQHNKTAAQARPDRQQIEHFCQTLAAELAVWTSRRDTEVTVIPERGTGVSPWEVARVVVGINRETVLPTDQVLPRILAVADELSATEVLWAEPEVNCIWVARLAQARYWSATAARGVARRIIWEHLEILLGEKRDER